MYENQKRWKVKNKSKQREYAKRHSAKKKALLNEYLLDKSCIKCGESRRPCLVFHHRDPTIKGGEIPKMCKAGTNWNKILIEIEKCDILCHNCHAVHHSEWGYGVSPIPS
jgi:hypothetical protein